MTPPTTTSSEPQLVSSLVVSSLLSSKTQLIFGIPGAKIDAVFNALLDHPQIRLIITRHEQNAAFMAAAYGRLTGRPGVCIATSGPGASNLTTGLATATTEGDPIVAIIGDVPRNMANKRTHQSMRALDVLAPVVKKTIQVHVEDEVPEALLSAFRAANSYPKGAVVVSLPQDIASLKTKVSSFSPEAFTAPLLGPGNSDAVKQVASMIQNAKLPVLLLGLRSAAPRNVSRIQAFLNEFPMPVVETFQAAGAVCKQQVHLFYGRIGLFRNQPGDKLLAKSDLILSIGYDPTEYDAQNWNPKGKLNVVHIDYQSCDYDFHYQPIAELIGSVAENFNALIARVEKVSTLESNDSTLKDLHAEFDAWKSTASHTSEKSRTLVQPLHFISQLQSLIPAPPDDDSNDGSFVPTTVITDVGTVYIYMMRHFFAYVPRSFLSSNGQQTLGVGLPWAISASLIQSPPCTRRVISLSGDGGFMFSSMELVTAVQQKCKITHFIWNDSAYNMVQFQEEMKYGRNSGVELGGIDFVKFAESFGAKGLIMENEDDVERILKEVVGEDVEGVVVVDVKIDYSRVKELAGHVIDQEYS
ncbi:MAG: hypothetical protein GOMPHAMPRED_007103 [Gomphillus americanus]|uniref:Pyruvate decarboxylase n=1 Tax=Gomphillus americanus TaxID=1940652 RepID=A0A8H3ESB7_9LECA|nr:MAG: hypothetical protein GOMPHAMPRED_007103 [Gomphillus americanus]